MALETLRGVKEIGGFPIEQYSTIGELLKSIKSGKHILVDHENNKISFRIQNGPIKENGVNGCQIDTVLEAVCLIIRKLNDNFPCEENEQAIKHIRLALEFLDARKKNREKRGVEGTNQV